MKCDTDKLCVQGMCDRSGRCLHQVLKDLPWMDKYRLNQTEIPKRVKYLLRLGHKRKCICCGTLDNLTFDHVIPLSKGGSNKSKSNGQILCERCNLAKGNKEITIDQLRNIIKL